MSQGKLRMKYPTSVNPNTGKQSCLLVHSFHFNLAELIFLKLPYDRRGVKTHFQRSHFILFSHILFWKFNMVLTRAQVDYLSREELIEELLKFSDITNKLNSLNNRFDDFIKKYDELNSELLISKNCNSLLLKLITNLERNALLITFEVLTFGYFLFTSMI